MTTIASYIDLSRYSGPILDQGQQGACKANQIVGAIQLQARQYGVNIQPLSRQQLYNDTREAVGKLDVDYGSPVGVAERIAVEKGIAFESSFTYGPHNMYTPTPDYVDAEAAQHKVLSFTNYGSSYNAGGLAELVGKQLMQGKAVMIDSFIRTGFGTTTDYRDYIDNPNVGGHAYLIVGIDWENHTYKIQNSWGTSWADGGYGTIDWHIFPNLGGSGTGTRNQDLIRVWTLNGFDGVDNTWTTERSQVGMLYAAVLERCADKSGLLWWANVMQQGVTQKQIIQFMYDGAEGQAKYGSLTNTQFVEEVYDNVLGRDVDSAGLAWYVSLLDNNTITRVDMLADIINNVDTGRDTQSTNDRLENLETFSTNYAVTYQIDNNPVNGYNYIQTITDNANTVQSALVGIHTEIFGY